MTREEYMSHAGQPDTFDIHRKYYKQFVTPAVQCLVLGRIGEDKVLSSTDPYLNDIPLGLWDAMEPTLRGYRDVRAKVKEAGDTWSLNTSVCILKEAARIIRDRNV